MNRNVQDNGHDDGLAGGARATGDAAVDRITARLDDLGNRPVAEHAEVYLDIQAHLSTELNPGHALRQAGADGEA